MKKCPFCAEEIQDAAIVCRHCGRDLKGGASQVQIVQPRKTSPFAWGCLTLFLVSGLFVAWCVSLMPDNRTTSARPSSSSAPTEPAAAPQINAEEMKREKKGKYGRHEYFAVQKDGQTIVLFTPALPRDDKAVIGAIRQVLADVLRVETKNVEVRPVGRFLRFLTGSGAYDVLLMKEDSRDGEWLQYREARVANLADTFSFS
jgi:hypothetical protein